MKIKKEEILFWIFIAIVIILIIISLLGGLK